MEKDVWVSVEGLQYGDNPEGDRIEIMTPGSYYRKKDQHYVMYDEIAEGGEEITRNVVKFDTDMISISKSGFTNVEMIFEKNKRNMTNYITPYGSLLVGIDASKVDVIENDEDIQVDIAYSLDVNYEHMADCRLHMDIRSRSGEDAFPLTQ